MLIVFEPFVYLIFAQGQYKLSILLSIRITIAGKGNTIT